MPRERYITIADAFLAYEQDVIPREAHRIQVQESRRAFYAGVAWLIGVMTDRSICADCLADILRGADAELDEFYDSVKNGNA